ncbi:MAG: macro domain-containing protein [Steroidobacteraceae bacterium]
MIRYTTGNLLEARADALVNTVNTVGVMGKGIALMFKERFEHNYELYADACKAKLVQTGKMFVTETGELDGPRWIVNFPTKQHWKAPSRMEWITSGLKDLHRFLIDQKIESIAIPPLGAGNGGLSWPEVKAEINKALGDLNLDILVFEPTKQYQNVAKRSGVEKLTPARALIAELVRRYWVLGMECSQLEVQKLAWFLERAIERLSLENSLNLKFEAHIYGPYARTLNHLLDKLDGSYLHSDKRIADSDPLDVIWFDEDHKSHVDAYLRSEAKDYLPALQHTAELINGFESPYGMELLATVDWLLAMEHVEPTVPALREGLKHWPAGASERKNRLFDDRALGIALNRLKASPVFGRTSY